LFLIHISSAVRPNEPADLLHMANSQTRKQHAPSSVYIHPSLAYRQRTPQLPHAQVPPMLIKQSDYQRIYRVINSLLVNENADPAVGAMYFATFGAFILKQHYKVNAVPKSGLAAYNLGGTLILFADHRDDGHVTGAGENFHCWVEADGWAIDFMAPAFSESARELALPSKMFQKPLSAMASDINALSQSGDFFYQSEPEASARRFAAWQKHALIGDLATVAAQWFRRSPKQMAGAISSKDAHGKIKEIPLIGNALSGSW